jgi:hypothetical protein
MPPAPLFAQVQRNGARGTRIEINVFERSGRRFA